MIAGASDSAEDPRPVGEDPGDLLEAGETASARFRRHLQALQGLDEDDTHQARASQHPPFSSNPTPALAPVPRSSAAHQPQPAAPPLFVLPLLSQPGLPPDPDPDPDPEPDPEQEPVVRRKQYHDYKSPEDTDLVTYIFTRFRNEGRGVCISALAQRTRTPRGTVRYWWKKYTEIPAWRPSLPDYRQWHLRRYSDDQEEWVHRQIVDDLRANLRPVNIETVRALFMTLTPIKEGAPERPSNCYLHCFKERWGYSTRAVHFIRKVVAPDDEMVVSFRQEMLDLFNSGVDPSLIINLDETQVKWVCSGNLRTWEVKGVDEVKVLFPGQEKEGITAVCCVRADGVALQPVFLRSEGARALHNSGLFDIIRRGKGWMTAVTLMEILERLKDPEGREVHLVMDFAASHRAIKVRQKAAECNIKIHLIPGGCTSHLQPLDVGVFGAVKMQLRAAFVQRLNTSNATFFLEEAMEKFQHIYLATRRETIDRAWRCLTTEEPVVQEGVDDRLFEDFDLSDAENQDDFDEETEADDAEIERVFAESRATLQNIIAPRQNNQ